MGRHLDLHARVATFMFKYTSLGSSLVASFPPTCVLIQYDARIEVLRAQGIAPPSVHPVSSPVIPATYPGSSSSFLTTAPDIKLNLNGKARTRTSPTRQLGRLGSHTRLRREEGVRGADRGADGMAQECY